MDSTTGEFSRLSGLSIKAQEVTMQMPFRELYIKGPGLIIDGDPKNFLTEIQITVE